MDKIIATISPTGEVTFKVEGVAGKKCLEITKPFEEALGLVLDRKQTPDYYKPSTAVKSGVKNGS